MGEERGRETDTKQGRDRDTKGSFSYKTVIMEIFKYCDSSSKTVTGLDVVQTITEWRKKNSWPAADGS